MPDGGAANIDTSNIVLVTGPSGAGRSTALNVFEDIGYETIDNLPLALLPRLLSGPPPAHPIALGIDVRTRDFSVEGVLQVLKQIESMDSFHADLLFLDCATDTLVHRFNETRRRHPFAQDVPVVLGVEREQDLLATLRNRADVLIDTTSLSPNALRDEIQQWFVQDRDALLTVSLQSFSYKLGIPRGLDMVLDCRFLKNPHWDPNLRPMTGLDEPVKSFITRDSRYQPFLDKTADLLAFLLPEYRGEGKTHFSLGLGCTGGQHRSTCMAEALASRLTQDGWTISIRHRELERRGFDVKQRT